MPDTLSGIAIEERPLADHECHDSDRGRVVAGAAEFAAPLQVCPRRVGVRAAAVQRRLLHALPVPGAPEGMERVDATEFVPAAAPPQPVAGAEVMPRVQAFLTVGHLYRGIEQGLSDLASGLGEPVLFVGEPRAQGSPKRFRCRLWVRSRAWSSGRATHYSRMSGSLPATAGRPSTAAQPNLLIGSACNVGPQNVRSGAATARSDKSAPSTRSTGLAR